MKKLVVAVLCIFCLSMVCAAGDKDDVVLKARMNGVNEVPPTASAGTGSFAAMISADGKTITYTLTYSNMNAALTQSHIHFGFPKESGGIMVWLCGTATNPGPAGTPVCPDDATHSGTVSGTLTAANVVGPNTQTITPGADFDKVIQAIQEGGAYVNVHTTRSPGGEIRGVVHTSDAGHHDRDDR